MGDKSLLQNTCERVKPLSDNIFVITEKSHSRHVYQQLRELPRRNILVEPARRGTASCFILALSEIKKRRLENQAILFLWADHLIEDKKKFAAACKHAVRLAETKN
jgi:mannose-1-phosphate guanylyltransferase